ALVDGVGAQRREAEVGDEALAQFFDHDAVGAAPAGARFESLQLGALPDVGAVADHLAAVVLLEPRHDDAGVEPARIGEHRALHVLLRRHCGCSCRASRAVSARWSLAIASWISAGVTLSGGSSRTARSPPRISSSPSARAAATSAGAS